MLKNNNMSNRIKVGLVQINNSFYGQNYLPYSVGILQAYAQKYLKNKDIFEFLLPIYRRSVKIAEQKLLDANVVFFSTYVWNIRTSLEIAKKIKCKNSDMVIVFGGPQIPIKCEEFLRKHTYIDIACHGEGEKTFLSILNNYRIKDWRYVPSISCIDNKGRFFQTKTGERISNIDDIPSPYIEGIFEPLISANPDEKWIALLETNRGCPFSCSYCAWSITAQKKIYSYNIERIYREIDWFSQHRIEFIFCCDANFGILNRDMDIIKYFVENKIKYGCPTSLSIQNTKRSTMHIYDIYKLMANAELNKGVSLSLQSTNKDTLESIRRENMSMDAFRELQMKFNKEHIETFTDIILGLPCETYDSFTNGVSTVIDNGQYNRIQFNNLSILTNSEMDKPEYQKKYGFDIVEIKFINTHGNLDAEDIIETQRLVIGTSSMSRNDWIKARAFSWMTSLLYFNKLLQIPFSILHEEYNINYRDIIENFMTNDNVTLPILSDIYLFFTDKAKNIQNGDTEYCKSEEWLDIWWPTDELMMIRLCAENMLSQFYKESEQSIIRFLEKGNITYCKSLLHDAFVLNQNLIKIPFQNEDIDIKLTHNIFDVYIATLKGEIVDIIKGEYCYNIDRTSIRWTTWKDWCKEVIWYGNKKGSYLYTCKKVSGENK